MPFLAPLIPAVIGAVGASAASAGIGALTGSGSPASKNPNQANISNPLAAGQQAQGYQGAQQGLTAQQNLLSALQGQNGLQNQSNVYNQLQGVASGKGPNPAQAMLAQATGQNVANQAAMAAGQRGAASNVGLMSRQAAQQGVNAQQQAAGQGATLQAQQSLGALGQMQGLATQQAGQQIGATQALSAAQQNEQQQLLNAQSAYNQAQVGSQGSVNAANAPSATANTQNAIGLGGGLLNGVGGAFNMLGGQQQAGGATGANAGAAGLAQGGQIGQPPPQPQNGPKSTLGQSLSGMLFAQGGPVTLGYAKGGTVPAYVSPGEKWLPPSAVEQVKRGADPMKVGQTIPGKPKVGGAQNSYSNDTVYKDLEEGGIVVPRSQTKSNNPSKNSRTFVAATLAKKKVKR